MKSSSLITLLPILICVSFVSAQTTVAPGKTPQVQQWQRLTTRPIQFGEGPVWNPTTNTLLFSDMEANIIYELNPNTQDMKVFRSPSGGSLGLGFDSKGRLIAAEGLSRRISRTEQGNAVTLADSFQGNKFNGPNDLEVVQDTVYFTDPDFGLPATEKQLNFSGVYRITPTGEVELISDKVALPNGIALSPDASAIYVADVASHSVLKFQMNPDGSVNSEPTVHITDVKGPDGIKVDAEGNIYVATEAGLEKFNSAGEKLGISPKASNGRPTNMAFGGADGKTIFITTKDAVYSIQNSVAGKVALAAQATPVTSSPLIGIPRTAGQVTPTAGADPAVMNNTGTLSNLNPANRVAVATSVVTGQRVFPVPVASATAVTSDDTAKTDSYTEMESSSVAPTPRRQRRPRNSTSESDKELQPPVAPSAAESSFRVDMLMLISMCLAVLIYC